MLDFIFKENSHINYWQIATPFITAITSLGAVYFGAWLTDKRREKEQHKININKAIILHTLIELQVPALIEYRKTLTKKLQAINVSNITVATERHPFSSWLLPINIKDYDYLINSSKGAVSALNQILQYQEQLNSAICSFNDYSLIDKENLNIFVIKMKCIIETMYETCDSLIYFSLLLHRYLTYILSEVYKEKITCSDMLMGINLVAEAKQLEWLKILPEDWQYARMVQI